MTEFSTPFGVKKSDRKLTKEELIRAIRLSIADEYEAIQVYEEIAESTEHEKAKKILLDIVEEEKIHVGEFMYLLKTLIPEEETFYNEGYKEAKEIIEEK
ncbi:rubrerythrin [bacterium]|nr:rubrerythrin [bacterium]